MRCLIFGQGHAVASEAVPKEYSGCFRRLPLHVLAHSLVFMTSAVSVADAESGAVSVSE